MLKVEFIGKVNPNRLFSALASVLAEEYGCKIELESIFDKEEKKFLQISEETTYHSTKNLVI